MTSVGQDWRPVPALRDIHAGGGPILGSHVLVPVHREVLHRAAAALGYAISESNGHIISMIQSRKSTHLLFTPDDVTQYSGLRTFLMYPDA